MSILDPQTKPRGLCFFENKATSVNPNNKCEPLPNHQPETVHFIFSQFGNENLILEYSFQVVFSAQSRVKFKIFRWRGSYMIEALGTRHPD